MAAIAAVPLATGREELTMKNPREISDTCWNSPDELKRTANRLKRLAGGLRSEVTAALSLTGVMEPLIVGVLEPV